MLTSMPTIKIRKTQESRIKDLDLGDLRYGRIYADHMFVADYRNGAWEEPLIMPYGRMELSPSISALHYGQSVFEGLKAFRYRNDKAGLFRHMDNFRRMNISATRMGMPEIPEYFFSEGLTALVNLDRQWIPSPEGCSLYIRPVMFATDEKIGVHISDSYRFVIFTTPVGIYFTKPLRVLVETEYVRAVQGGVGYAKAAGNYGASMFPGKIAQQKGYDQIIWTDAADHKYLEEAGTMNVMAVIGDTLVTPPLGNTTLAGITRDSVLTIASDWGVRVEERKISIDEVLEELSKGNLREMFGVGTAATVTNIAVLGYLGQDYSLPEINDGLLSSRVRRQLEAIRTGKTDDKFGWMTIL
jgi:branched-chain amino acid aminotransferase